MGRIYKFLGLSVGCIVHGLTDPQRKEAYNSDITYGQNNEFGFDYLRDNMKFSLEDYVQREHNFAIVHHVNQGLKAHALFKLDVDYVVKEGQVIIVDEFTGRLMPGRRWSDG